MLEPALYVVATPIGNLADISRRAVEVLAHASVIAAEDTRRTGQLLRAEGIRTSLFAYHEHSGASAAEQLVARICAGESVALVTDAGTPMISDPGYRLVRAVQDAGGRVVPVPGACAAISALSAAGLPSDRFTFEGFLSSKAEARRRRLMDLRDADATLVFYEAPHRLLDTLQAMAEIFGAEREAAVARELTKAFETLRRAPLGQLAQWVGGDANQQRGEIVLLVAPDRERTGELDSKLRELARSLAEHLPARKVSTLLAAYSGLRSKQFYDFLLEQRRD